MQAVDMLFEICGYAETDVVITSAGNILWVKTIDLQIVPLISTCVLKAAC